MNGNAAAGASRLIGVLQSQGFTRTDRDHVAMLHQRAFELSRFGMIDTVVGIATTPTATAESLRSLDEQTKAGSLELKSSWPLGLGGAVEIFPVLFADEADQAAIDAANAAGPKRWAIMSTHALVHGDPPSVELFEGRVLWGAAYVKGQRRRLRAWLGASS